jgi:hypothetical protein
VQAGLGGQLGGDRVQHYGAGGVGLPSAGDVLRELTLRMARTSLNNGAVEPFVVMRMRWGSSPAGWVGSVGSPIVDALGLMWFGRSC